MDARTELEQLLAELLDGQANDTPGRRLDELLRAHPELHGDYIEHMQLHALLQWRAGTAPTPRSEPAMAGPAPGPALSGRPAWRSGRKLAAALLVLAASLAVFFVFQIPSARATPDVLDRIINLNLDIAVARTPAERERIYQEQAGALRETLARAELPAEDRKIAESLLDTSLWLTQTNDPAAEADRFSEIADTLVAGMDAATVAQDDERTARLAGAYQRLAEVGVRANLERAHASSGLDHARKQKLSHSAFRHDKRARQVDEIIQRNPEPARKAIHRAMKGHKGKKH